MIYEVRGKQVILDSDLSKLYGVETKVFNRQVKRNIERFPEDFCFRLTDTEYRNLRCQIGTSKLEINNHGGRRYNPYVFTENGVSMLASILHSKVAIKTSINIIRAFVSMRKYISHNLIEQNYINKMVIKHDKRIEYLEESFNKLEEAREVNEIYFDGKIYDAHSKIIDIFSEAKKELTIVDRYTDKSLLDMIKDLECKVILITGKKTKLTSLDVEKYNKTYNNLIIYYDDTYHDRYFVIDRKKIYHSGNSINHIGYRKSSINVLRDENVKNIVLRDIDNIIK